jgi:hypothetical protein
MYLDVYPAALTNAETFMSGDCTIYIYIYIYIFGAAVIGNSCCGFPANECISMMAK